ncbi:MAG: hypothetical protein J6J36_02145 [Clostridia bacterium]|nr:hypothetical protein [Clostridia bacterium]
MVVIGVSGGSGAGKSTVSDKLAEILPNAVHINVDKYMYEESLKQEPVILRSLGIEKEKGVYTYNYYFQSFDYTKVWVSYIQKGVSDKIENFVKEQEAIGMEYAVVDWCFLPMCEFSKKCDYTLNVKTDYNTRIHRLEKKLKEMAEKNTGVDNLGIDRSYNAYKDFGLDNRLKYTTVKDFGYGAQFELQNDEGLEILEKNLKDYANKIMNKEK